MNRRDAVRTAVLGVAGALLGLALVFLVLNVWGPDRWSDRGARPDGADAAFGLDIGLAVLAIAALAAGVAWTARAWRARRTVAVISCGLLVSLVPGWYAHGALIGPRLDVRWTAPPSSAETAGTWGVGSTLVRARADGLTAYNVRDGEERWTLAAPSRESVCAMSSRTAGGTGLVAFARHEKPCTTAALVDLSTGRTVWRRALTGDDTGTAGTDGRIALADGTAVVSERGAVRGLDAADGRQRWIRRTQAGCRVVSLDAGARRAVLVERCGAARDSWRLVTLDARTGGRIGVSALPVESDLDELQVLSAEPAVLRFKERDRRGTDALLAFDDRGRGPVVVPASDRRRDLVLYDAYGRFAARPAGQAVVADGIVVAIAREQGARRPRSVTAHSLADGRELWTKRYGRDVTALARRADGDLAVLTTYGYDGTVHRLDPRTGRGAGEALPVSGRDRLFPVGAVDLHHDGRGFTFTVPGSTVFGARPR
ncbi:PQQ-binding-like beta-propeller repeat protein [Streptomyces sp. I05A-00742]|uniref:outer membrane protein assembly factor BamB family protein n=1 Tax=Streptomyces sp. I05A-00742 TaxID=2732853 RepID=UPI001487940E|nr:PQQ-binding-like beta-propeller repeat protein [Streptomyces sp. I05A-00742]